MIKLNNYLSQKKPLARNLPLMTRSGKQVERYNQLPIITQSIISAFLILLK